MSTFFLVICLTDRTLLDSRKGWERELLWYFLNIKRNSQSGFSLCIYIQFTLFLSVSADFLQLLIYFITVFFRCRTVPSCAVIALVSAADAIAAPDIVVVVVDYDDDDDDVSSAAAAAAGEVVLLCYVDLEAVPEAVAQTSVSLVTVPQLYCCCWSWGNACCGSCCPV
jgi:hypothetical protein